MPPELLISGVGITVLVPALVELAKRSGLPTQYAGLASIVAAGLVLGLVQLQSKRPIRRRRRLAAALPRLWPRRGRLLQPGAQAAGRAVESQWIGWLSTEESPWVATAGGRSATGGGAVIG